MSSDTTSTLMSTPVPRYSPIESATTPSVDIHIPSEEILLHPPAFVHSDSEPHLQPRSPWWKSHPLIMIISLIFITTGIILSIILLSSHTSSSYLSTPPIAPCDIFCYGDILSTIQSSGIFNDSKTFVDKPLLRSPQDVMADFQSLPNNDTATLISFLSRNFGSVESDLIPWTPSDYNASFALLNHIKDPALRLWAHDLNQLWTYLGRQITQDVYDHPERHTLLRAFTPYMIVPGGRFREYYYWDSYWIVKGLITCDMIKTAKVIVENLLYFVRVYGFVPNGSRLYYLNRSQPPFLTLTVQAYVNATGDQDFLRDALPILDKEYQYWMTINGHAVQIKNQTTGTSYILNRYYSNVNYPRPESYAEDMATALSMPWPFNPEGNKKRQEMFAQLAASAETGWDFSSRFFQDRRNLSSANTMDIIPVDLNSVLYINERILANWHMMMGNMNSYSSYQQAAEIRLDAIYAILWDESTYQWRDYNWIAEESMEVVASNFIPLWAKSYRTSQINESRIIDAFLSSKLILPGGIVTTLSNIGQQWDWPNAWAPVQHMLIEGLVTTDGDRGIHLAQQIATSWLVSNWIAYNTTGYMFEKYVATQRGIPGHGGEYYLQKGFGWSNGVALILLEQYGDILNLTQAFSSSAIYDLTQYDHFHTYQTTSSPTSRLYNMLSPHLNMGTYGIYHRPLQIPPSHSPSVSTISTYIRKHQYNKYKSKQISLQPHVVEDTDRISLTQFPHHQAYQYFIEIMESLS